MCKTAWICWSPFIIIIALCFLSFWEMGLSLSPSLSLSLSLSVCVCVCVCCYFVLCVVLFSFDCFVKSCYLINSLCIYSAMGVWIIWGLVCLLLQGGIYGPENGFCDCATVLCGCLLKCHSCFSFSSSVACFWSRCTLCCLSPFFFWSNCKNSLLLRENVNEEA